MNKALMVLLLSACVVGSAARTSLAAGETTYVTDTPITINGISLTILAGSTAQSVNFGTSLLTVTAGTGNTLTLRATDTHTILTNDGGLSPCGSGNAELTITSGVVVVAPSATGCPLTVVPESRPVTVTGGGAFLGSIAPTALSSGVNGVPLSFAINDGAPTTTQPTVTLHLNADPRTVRGYVISLDPTFRQTSIVNYTPTVPATFTLPQQPGSYTVYFKYYSVTGDFSNVFRQQIALVAESAASTTISQKTPALAARPLFTRVLKLGSRGADVRALQVYLNTHGFRLDGQGAGSPGREGLVYGSLTAKAVSRFQEANARVLLTPFKLKKGTGIFGTVTKNFVNATSN